MQLHCHAVCCHSSSCIGCEHHCTLLSLNSLYSALPQRCTLYVVAVKSLLEVEGRCSCACFTAGRRAVQQQPPDRHHNAIEAQFHTLSFIDRQGSTTSLLVSPSSTDIQSVSLNTMQMQLASTTLECRCRCQVRPSKLGTERVCYGEVQSGHAHGPLVGPCQHSYCRSLLRQWCWLRCASCKDTGNSSSCCCCVMVCSN
jgi:hypothetical protein